MPAARLRTACPGPAAGRCKPDEDPWQTVGPSAIPFDQGWNVPTPLDADGIARLVESFAQAAKRAERAGFDYVELHGAHGYLMHEFLSPFSNKREDEYGGPLENRMRLILEVARAVRAALPKRMLVGARLSASEWTDGGFSPDEAVVVARALKEAGVGYVCASSGGNFAKAQIPFAPLYQVPFAEKIRREAGIVTRAVGLITEPEEAEAIVAEGKADMVALARAILADPRWPWRAAAALGAEFAPPPQYARAAPTMRKWAAPAKRGRAPRRSSPHGRKSAMLSRRRDRTRRQRRKRMPFYMIQASYKETAAKALIARPHDRSEVVRKMIESLGGKLHSFFLAFGDYDVMAIVEAPSNEAAVAAGLATVSGGALSNYRTTVFIPPKEAVAAMKKAKKIAYTPPK